MYYCTGTYVIVFSNIFDDDYVAIRDSDISTSCSLASTVSESERSVVTSVTVESRTLGPETLSSSPLCYRFE